jgi:ribosomal protein S18 acetylase RimI-like enzyme
MSLRPFRLSTDLRICAEILPLAFQYPENPSWNMQDDEAESMVGMLSGVARVWPVIRFFQFVFPSLRDYVRGYMWEEGQPVGVILLHRQGKTPVWEIVRAAVLPDYRRQGIGRRLVQASVDYMRERGGKVVLLDVIAGNIPAYELYIQTGFEPFERRIAFDYTRDGPPPEISQPEGCTISSIGPADWRYKYELALRTVPSDVQRFQPIQEAHFQPRLSGQLATWVTNLVSATQERSLAIRASAGGEVIAVAGYSARTRPGGVNSISIRINPNRAEIAPYLLHNLIRTTQSLSPGRRIEFTVPHWQSEMMEAANAAGCVKHLEYHRMGMLL